jgi:hypothetical protein
VTTGGRRSCGRSFNRRLRNSGVDTHCFEDAAQVKIPDTAGAMNIALGMRIHEGPWGGGNQFGISLSTYLRQQGHQVETTLDRPDIDMILLTEARRGSASSSFNDIDVLRYLSRVNSNALVAHRVNECDRGRNTRLRDPRLAIANGCADHTVFISQWLETHFREKGYRFAAPSVIRNGADNSVFHGQGAAVWNPPERLRIVTHHWSDNWMKGFDVYAAFDRMLGTAGYRELFEFTHIGRLPPGQTLPNTTCEPPLVGHALAARLRAHHVYLTAAQNEGAGMHHIEGALCGLPLLYRESGALPEYCVGFGLPFTAATFSDRLREIRDLYPVLKASMASYPYDADTMCLAYAELFGSMVENRQTTVSARKRSWAATAALIVRATYLDTLSTVIPRGRAFLGVSARQPVGLPEER